MFWIKIEKLGYNFLFNAEVRKGKQENRRVKEFVHLCGSLRQPMASAPLCVKKLEF